MNITTTIFDNDEIITNSFANKTALTIYLVQEAELASKFRSTVKITVQIDNRKPAIYSAPAKVSLDEKLKRIEKFVENLK